MIIIQHLIQEMPQRRAWTQEQDRILKYLKQELQITKWSTIAKKMADEHSMPDRTGKQCRQRYNNNSFRYHNHLDSTILRTEWTPEQEQYLYKLHDEIGNKWAIIAQKLPGRQSNSQIRTDNCVKNHFYSKMRKAIRKLNKIIYQYYKKELKQIKMTVLYKIVQATDERFKNNPSIEEEISQKCCSTSMSYSGLKNLLLLYSNDGSQLESDVERLGFIAKEIHQFSGKYRRKVKKTRRASVSGQQLLMKLPKFDIGSARRGKSMSDCEEEGSQIEDQEYQNALSHQYDDDDLTEQQDKCLKLGKPLEQIKQVDDLKQSINSKIDKPMNQITLMSPETIAPSMNLTNQSQNQPSPTRSNLIKPPPLIKPALMKPPQVEQGSRVQQFLRNKGIVQQEVESPLHLPNHPYPYPHNHHFRVIRNSSLADSVHSMEDENRNLDFLSIVYLIAGQSIEKMKICCDQMMHEVQIDVDDQNRLFPSV